MRTRNPHSPGVSLDRQLGKLVRKFPPEGQLAFMQAFNSASEKWFFGDRRRPFASLLSAVLGIASFFENAFVNRVNRRISQQVKTWPTRSHKPIKD